VVASLRMRAFARRAAIALLVLACAASPAAKPAPGWSAKSDSGRLTGRLAPEGGAAVEIGKFQIWILELRTSDGAAAAGAAVAIAGGMPGHGHGLPTQPQVTEELGMGRYRIEGVKLNMAGAWVIEVFVESAGARDRLRFDLDVDY
jgi:YtkA-like